MKKTVKILAIALFAISTMGCVVDFGDVDSTYSNYSITAYNYSYETIYSVVRAYGPYSTSSIYSYTDVLPTTFISSSYGSYATLSTSYDYYGWYLIARDYNGNYIDGSSYVYSYTSSVSFY